MNNWDRFQDMPYENHVQPPTVTRGGLYNADGLRDGVIVPGLQAVITGVLFGVAVLAVAAWLSLPFLAIGGTTAAVIMAVSWLAYRSRWQFVLEKITGADLNMDGFIGAPVQPALPAPQPETVRIELIKDQGWRGDFIDLPYPEKLPELAAGLLAGRTFNQTAWTGHGAIFSRSEFDNLRDTLIERGLASWKNPDAKAQGVTLTAAGRAVMRRLATPTLPSENRR